MNTAPKTAGKVVTSSSNMLHFRYGNILHTGGVVGSTPTASTNLPATFGRRKNVPLGSVDPMEERTHMSQPDEITDAALSLLSFGSVFASAFGNGAALLGLVTDTNWLVIMGATYAVCGWILFAHYCNPNTALPRREARSPPQSSRGGSRCRLIPNPQETI